MFDTTVSLPLWLFLLLLLAAGYAVVMSVLFPGVRWFFRRRLNRAVDRLNTSLQIKIRPLQATKRQVLIDQLIFDPQVIAMIEAQAIADKVPREVLQHRVRGYAREIDQPDASTATISPAPKRSLSSAERDTDFPCSTFCQWPARGRAMSAPSHAFAMC